MEKKISQKVHGHNWKSKYRFKKPAGDKKFLNWTAIPKREMHGKLLKNVNGRLEFNFVGYIKIYLVL